jgi:hypothetical protein
VGSRADERLIYFLPSSAALAASRARRFAYCPGDLIGLPAALAAAALASPRAWARTMRSARLSSTLAGFATTLVPKEGYRR